MLEGEGTVEEEEKEEVEEDDAEEEEDESVKEEQEKARIDEIWAAFKSDTGQKPAKSSGAVSSSRVDDASKAR